MGYSHVTITYNPDANGYARPSFSPADALSVGLNTNGSFVWIDNGDFFFENKTSFMILDKPYGSHSNNYGTFTITSGVQYSVNSIFGDAAQPGRYIFIQNFSYPDLSNIPLVAPYTHVGEPSSPTLASTISREAVTLTWGAGSGGANNSVTGYDVQYRESSDGSSWGGWQTENGSPVAGTEMTVSPSETVGNYRQYRVRTRGSAGESWYSGWVVSTNTLRKKWGAFGAWTDPILVAGVSGIRSVHLTQLQDRVAVIRAFYGLAGYAFTAIQARKTKIAKWATLIGEIRNAIDGITTSHEAWNTLQTGKPRIAHITQLRKIIDAMSGETETGAPFIFNINAYGHLLCSSNTSDVLPFSIDESGHLIYSYTAGEALEMAIDADGHLILTTEG